MPSILSNANQHAEKRAASKLAALQRQEEYGAVSSADSVVKAKDNLSTSTRPNTIGTIQSAGLAERKPKGKYVSSLQHSKPRENTKSTDQLKDCSKLTAHTVSIQELIARNDQLLPVIAGRAPTKDQ